MAESSSFGSGIKRRAIVISALLLCVVSYSFIHLGSWHWEVRVPARQGALRMVLPQDLSTLELVLSPRDPGGLLGWLGFGASHDQSPTGFLLADSAAAVQDFWVYRAPARNPSAGAPVVAPSRCTPASGPCQMQNDRLVLSFPPATQAPPAQPQARRPFQREIFLIPLSDDPTSLEVGPVPTLSITEIAWRTGSGQPLRIIPEDCVRRLKEQEGKCRFADSLLGRPTAVNRRDPQPYIVALSVAATAKVVPALILTMIIVNILLFGVAAVLLLMTPRLGQRALAPVQTWLAQDQSADNAAARTGARLILHIDQLLVNWRRLFEYLEVTGPALGFLLTVGSLLLAFDPAIFSERDTGRFTQAMSMALTATFAGLLMRILAFSCDRLTEFYLRLDANPSGFLKTQPLNNTGPVAPDGAPRSSAATEAPAALTASQGASVTPASGSQPAVAPASGGSRRIG